jgi:hypothetical protein
LDSRNQIVDERRRQAAEEPLRTAKAVEHCILFVPHDTSLLRSRMPEVGEVGWAFSTSIRLLPLSEMGGQMSQKKFEKSVGRPNAGVKLGDGIGGEVEAVVERRCGTVEPVVVPVTPV